MAGILSAPSDFTDRDFSSIRDRCYSLVRSVFPDWTDQNIADFGNILVELFSFVGGTLSYYEDNIGAETRWGTATQRRNLINLCKMISFKPATNRAATVDETVTILSGGAGRVTFRSGSIFKTADIVSPVSFQIAGDDVVAAAGTNPRTLKVSIENSSNQNDLFAANGLSSQQCRLSTTPYIDDSAVVGAQNGVFVQVNDFLDSGPTDRHFVVEVDQNDRGTVIFGDGQTGALPTGTISIDYRTGGGATGNIEPGLINKFPQSISDEFGAPVAISVTNAAKASGGANRQTVKQIQKLAPLSIRAINRTVAREDFEINALRLSQVARVLCLTSNEDPSVPENTGILFPIPVGGGLPSTELKDLVKQQVTVKYPSTLTFVVLVQNPLYLAIDFSAVIFPKAGFTGEQVRLAIESALADFFEISLADGTPNPTIDFGFNFKNALGQPAGSIPFSDLFNVVRDVASVRKIGAGPSDFMVNGARADVPILTRQFPVLGTVSLVNGDSGHTL